MTGALEETGRQSKPSGRGDLLLCLVPVVTTVALCIWFRAFLTSGLWWDEQWRAYHVVLPGIHLDLGGTYAPTSPAWLLIDKFSVVLFGMKEWAFRIPSVVAWLLIGPLTFRLCRRLMGRTASVVASTALSATPAILYFGTELKPYATETLATVAIILAWARAHETRGKRRLIWYAAMALVSLVSVPALFIVGPLLGLDVVRACRNSRAAPGDLRILLATVAATSAAVAVPLAVTVLPQPAGAQYSYFNFLSANPWEAFETGAREVVMFLAAAWTSASMIRTDTHSLPLDSPTRVLFTCAEWGVALLVILGAWHLRKSMVGVGLTSVLLGGFALQVVTSLLHLWPLGIARVNLFMLPVVYVLTVAGLVGAWGTMRNSAKFLQRTTAVLIVSAGTVLVGGMLVQNAVTTAALHRDIPMHRWAEDVRSVVEAARSSANAGTIALVQMDGSVSGFFAEPRGAPRGLGWIVYMDHYSYPTRVGRQIPLSDTFFADLSSGRGDISDFLADHRRARSVVEYAALGGDAAGSAAGSLLTTEIRGFGFVPYSYRMYEDSGELTIWRR